MTSFKTGDYNHELDILMGASSWGVELREGMVAIKTNWLVLLTWLN